MPKRLIVPVLRQSDSPAIAQSTVILNDGYAEPLGEILLALQARAGARLGLPPQDVLTEGDVGLPRYRWPWLTTGIVAVLAGTFAAELNLAVTPATKPGIVEMATRVAFGGVSRGLLQSGQWWRLLTAAFLHASPWHLLANSAALVMAGYWLERFAGRAWTLCLFMAGVLAGSLGSIAINPPEVVSVGASGAVMAMLAGMFLIGFHLPWGRVKSQMLGYSLCIAVPSLVPVERLTTNVAARFGGMVDYGGHAGGVIAGLLLGTVMLLNWRSPARLPGLRPFAWAAGGIGVAAVLIAAVLAAQTYPAYAALGPLIPQERFRDRAELYAHANDVLAHYPDDPRASFLVGVSRLQAGDLEGAEHLIRVALTKLEFQQWRFQPRLRSDYQAELANVLTLLHRDAEAQLAAATACHATGPAAPDPAFRAILRDAVRC